MFVIIIFSIFYFLYIKMVMVEEISSGAPEWGNKEKEWGNKEKKWGNKVHDWMKSIRQVLIMTPKRRKAKEMDKIRNRLITEKNMIIETYNKYPQKTRDRIKEELKDLYEKYETWQIMDFDVGDSNAWSLYRYIRPKKENSNKDYTDFFGVLFDGIDPYKSTYEEVKIKSSLINAVIKEIIWEEEMKRIDDKVWNQDRDE